MREDSFKYGMPLLCAAWVSPKIFLVGGGGGTAATGIKNRVLLAKFENGVMSDQLTEMPFGSQTPVRSCVHPETREMIIGMTGQGVKHLKIDPDNTSPSITDVTASPVMDAFESIHEEALALVFSSDGRFLIAGFESGWIQVWQWPEMNIRMKLREEAIYATIKDLDVSQCADPLFLILSTAKGTAELMDLSAGNRCHNLPKPASAGGRFVHCKFLPSSQKLIFYTTVLANSGAFIFKWQILDNDITHVKLLKKVKTGSEAISTFCVHRKVMVMGTSEGNIAIHTTGRMLPMQLIRGAHMVFTTAVSFPPTSEDQGPTGVLSISGDASAKVTVIEYKGETGLWLKGMAPYLILNLFLVIAAVLLLLKSEEGFESTQTSQEL